MGGQNLSKSEHCQLWVFVFDLGVTGGGVDGGGVDGGGVDGGGVGGGGVGGGDVNSQFLPVSKQFVL